MGHTLHSGSYGFLFYFLFGRSPFFSDSLRSHCTKSNLPQYLPMGFPSRGKAFVKSMITHVELILSCFRFSSSCLGEPDYPAGYRIIHRKLRQQSKGGLSYYCSIGCRPTATATLANAIRLTGTTSRDNHLFFGICPIFSISLRLNHFPLSLVSVLRE